MTWYAEKATSTESSHNQNIHEMYTAQNVQSLQVPPFGKAASERAGLKCRVAECFDGCCLEVDIERKMLTSDLSLILLP